MNSRISCLVPGVGKGHLPRIPSSYTQSVSTTTSARARNRRVWNASQRHSSALVRPVRSLRSSTAAAANSRRPPIPMTGSRHLHSSSRAPQPTTSMDFGHSYPSILNPHWNTPRPSKAALKTLFVASMVPMVGFGFMDNLVMIQAGQYIDSTLGVSLGLATMTAAAAGQVVSDVSGVVFGGTLEQFLHKAKLIENPALSMAQRQLAICRHVSMLGAVVGVVIGCALGATTLLLVDLEARDRITHAAILRQVVDDMIGAGQQLPCQACVVYVEHDADFTMQKIPEDSRTTMQALHKAASAIVRQCATERRVISDNDGSVLYIPVVKDDNIMAVLEIKGHGFTRHHEQLAQVMAEHLAIFMTRLAE